MGNSNSKDAIGFPPPLLGEQPYRLPILQQGEGWIALEKPAGPLIDAHPLYPDAKAMVEGIRIQVEAGKPELERLGLGKVSSVYFLEPEVQGIALLASSHDVREQLRNAFGSMQFEFTFEMFGKATGGADDLVCEAPLNYYSKEGRVIISRRHGKKAKTHFRRVDHGDGIARWLARTDYPRPQQIRLHAKEVGLEIIGETLDVEDQSEKSMKRGPDRLLEQLGLCLRLESIKFPFNGQEITIKAYAPKLWRSILRRIERND